MGFKLSEGASAYLKKLKKNQSNGKFDYDFDFYYLCAVLGMTFRRCISLNGGDEITRNFPSKYDKYKHSIIALLIEAEKERTGKDSSIRKEFEKFMLDLVDPHSPTQLNSIGEERLNCYAQGGYELLSERVGSVESLDVFFVKYRSLFDELEEK
ncbi:MAG: hypothetical protein GX941_00170 [Candidatus Methanofastidiosa archaeon]|jgi:hypothetical protein|nr:hypothetical protein [Candidatus Methanofastidiosa archaeon]